jgi:hypothetical protein
MSIFMGIEVSGILGLRSSKFRGFQSRFQGLKGLRFLMFQGFRVSKFLGLIIFKN